MPKPITGASRGDPTGQVALGWALFPRSRPLAYAQLRLAAMHGLPGAEKAVGRMRLRISIADRIAAVGILSEALAPPPAPLPRAMTGWSPDREADAVDLSALRTATPKIIRVGSHPIGLDHADAPAGWRVQLGAFRRAGGADRHWAALRRTIGTLAAISPTIVSAGDITRLQVLVPDRAAAAQICARVTAAGQGCFAIAPRSAMRVAVTDLTRAKQI